MLLTNCPAALSGRFRAFQSGNTSSACRRQRRAGRQAASAVAASTNGNGVHKTTVSPSPAETARTLVDIVNEGTLSTVCKDGFPLGTPVTFSLDSDGHPLMTVSTSDVTAQLISNPKCSLLVQPIEFPARAVASVSLIGEARALDTSNTFRLSIDKCLYFGGLDQSSDAVEVQGDAFKAAQPDVLRKHVVDLVCAWNQDHAEDIYRIVASYLGASVNEMAYAELLWVDHLGLYARAEVAGEASQVVRVPFYRPVLDERDARSVMTMAAQLAWEKERNYVPPTPAALAEAAASEN